MKDQDELISIQNMAAELGLPYSIVYDWTTQGRKAKNPGDTIHTRVCLQVAPVGKQFRTTRRWVAEFIEKANIGKATLLMHLEHVKNAG